MTQLRVIFKAMFFLISMNCCSQQNSTEGSSVLGVFVGSTPCSEGSRPLPGISTSEDCKLIKWKLTLYQDAAAKTPTTYKLHALYGLPKQGTTGLTGGGKEIETEGEWAIIKNTGSTPSVIVYRLKDKKTTRTISFLKLNDNLLHLLDTDQRLMIGSAAWSYTLNRVDNQ